MMDGKIWTVLWGCLAILYVMGEDDSKNVVFPAESGASSNSSESRALPEAVKIEERRNGKNLLDWLGFTIGGDTDPYLSKANAACLGGDLSECFKSKALTSLEEFFDKDAYTLSDHARVVKMPSVQLRALEKEPYEFSSETRAEESEWDQFVKYVMRQVEKFVKSTAIEVRVPDDVLAEGRYAPRFIDDISSEIDIIEDKTDNVFKRTKLKKLFIPLLIILKLFKLKLLLFLPFILGLASFKKLLGFLAIVIPGLIGFFKLCKPDLQHNYGSYGHSMFYYRPPQHHHAYPPHPTGAFQYVRGQDTEEYQYPIRQDAYGYNTAESSVSSSSVAFKDHPDAQQLAYQGYKEYQTS